MLGVEDRPEESRHQALALRRGGGGRSVGDCRGDRRRPESGGGSSSTVVSWPISSACARITGTRAAIADREQPAEVVDDFVGVEADRLGVVANERARVKTRVGHREKSLDSKPCQSSRLTLVRATMVSSEMPRRSRSRRIRGPKVSRSDMATLF